MKSSNLRCSLAHSQNKELSKHQSRASQLQTGCSPQRRQRGRHATARVGRHGATSAPEMASFTRLSRLPVANQVFLGSWMVDIHQEVCNQRSAPHRRHRAQLRCCSHCAPRKPRGWDWGGDKMHCSLGEIALAKHLVA